MFQKSFYLSSLVFFSGFGCSRGIFFCVLNCYDYLRSEFYKSPKIAIRAIGALTSKPYAFNARPWELSSITTIDLNDSTGVNIRVDLKESEIIRILPRECDSINEEWISNKTRFFYDGLKITQLKNSLTKISSKKYNFLSIKNTLDLFSLFFSNISKVKSKSVFIYDCFANLETISSIKTLSNICGVSNIKYSPSVKILNDETKSFIFNIDRMLSSNLCLLIGINPRFEATSINLKLRKNFRKGLFTLGSIGVSHDLTFPSYFFGVSNQRLKRIFEGRTSLSKKIKNTMKVFCVYGNSLTTRKDSIFMQKFLNASLFFLKENQITFSFLGAQPNITGSLLINANNSRKLEQPLIAYINGSDSDSRTKQLIKKGTVLNVSNSSTLQSKSIDLVSFCKNIVEESGTFVNCFGLSQKSLSVIPGSKNSRSTKKILSFFLASLNQFDTTQTLKKHLKIEKNYSLTKVHYGNSSFRLFKTSYVANVNNFYTTNSISKLSKTLLKCSSVYKKNFQNFI